MAFKDLESIRELFDQFGSVSVRRMFGGHGVFADGMMFALEQDGELYLKADDLTIPKLAAEKSEPFVYKARGREIALSYWKLPERLYDEPDEFTNFAREAFGAAQRAAGGSQKRATKTTKAPKLEPAAIPSRKSKPR